MNNEEHPSTRQEEDPSSSHLPDTVANDDEFLDKEIELYHRKIKDITSDLTAAEEELGNVRSKHDALLDKAHLEEPMTATNQQIVVSPEQEELLQRKIELVHQVSNLKHEQQDIEGHISNIQSMKNAA